MYWTLELAHHLEEAPWPATRDELIDYAIRSGAPLEVIENLQEMEDEGEIYESMEDRVPGQSTELVYWEQILPWAYIRYTGAHNTVLRT